MLVVQVLNFIDLFLQDEFTNVKFSSFKFGLIGIYKDHEDMTFKITPCKIILNKEKEIIELYSGYGFASVHKNNVKILGFPICHNKKEYDLKCLELEKEYGIMCKKNFQQFIE